MEKLGGEIGRSPQKADEVPQVGEVGERGPVLAGQVAAGVGRRPLTSASGRRGLVASR